MCALRVNCGPRRLLQNEPMDVVYDTTTVHPLDRYDHYRAGAKGEMAPVEVYGRAPLRLRARMTVRSFGPFDLEELTWEADTEITTRRTGRLIRAGDPERYRLLLGITGEIQLEQANRRERIRRGDIGMYDMSQPWRSAHPPEAGPMRVMMLTFPRGALSVDEQLLRPLNGTLTPRRQRERSQMVQLLTNLHGATESTDHVALLTECTLGLILGRLNRPSPITPQTRQKLNLLQIQTIIKEHLADPALDPGRIAQSMDISLRQLHKLVEGSDLTTMQLLKRMRLHESRLRLEDPACSATSIREIAAACGYSRADQFARDFGGEFGVTPTRARAEATDRKG